MSVYKNIFLLLLNHENKIMISNIDGNKTRLFELCIIIPQMMHFYIIT